LSRPRERRPLLHLESPIRAPGRAAPLDTGNQDYKSLVSKAVFRWEWRPGSTLYIAWTQSRFDEQHPGHFGLGRVVRALFRAPGDDVFLIKTSYWFSRLTLGPVPTVQLKRVKSRMTVQRPGPGRMKLCFLTFMSDLKR